MDSVIIRSNEKKIKENILASNQNVTSEGKKIKKELKKNEEKKMEWNIFS